MDPELTRLEGDFEQNIDRWLSKQGIIFQLKHASTAGSVLPKICGLLFRILILLILLLVAGWFYLTSQVSSESFKEKVGSNLITFLNASGGDINSIERHKGGLLNAQLKISNFELESSENSFYEDWYTAREKRGKDGSVDIVNEKKIFTAQSVVVEPLGIGDGIISAWSGKNISVGILNCHLKTGADTDAKALASYQSIFKEGKELTVNNITIEEANIGWGYEVSKGSISGATIAALRKDDVWYITVTKGKFSHGWLKNADIQSMQLECHRNGLIKVVEAKLKLGSGVISFHLDIQMKAKPEASGSYEFKGVKVLDLVGQEYSPYLSGKIKGEGTLKGTLNSAQGISAKTKVTLSAPMESVEERKRESEDLAAFNKRQLSHSFLIIRGKFPILETMKELNKVNSYNLLRLNLGKFVIEQTGGDTVITGIEVRSGDFLEIEGALKYVWSKVKIADDVKVDLDAGLNDIISEENNISEIAEQETAIDRMVKTFSGVLQMGFVTEVFDNHPEILKEFPEEPDTLRVWLPVKMQGEIKEASTEIADRLNKIVQEARGEKENE